MLIDISFQAQSNLERLGIGPVIKFLSDYELTIASQLVSPDEITISWNDIAGLDDIIDELKATIILPMKVPDLYNYSKLHEPPKGVLLYGPPGVGKTMIAKATAKEAGARLVIGFVFAVPMLNVCLFFRFINLDISALTDKWYGESQKLAAAVFTLAIKIQPCIIFIDEIDTFLRKRETHDHEATSMMKAQFMILWDGLISTKNCSVVVMGATNRPNDVDAAIRRRMPATFYIAMPSAEKRLKILQLIMQNEEIDADVNMNTLANLTENFSGSDLKELCRSAAMSRVKELSTDYKALLANSDTSSYLSSIRAINQADFAHALEKMKRTRISSHEFVDNYNFD